MKIYFPMIVYNIHPDDKDVCDFIMQGFLSESDAKDLYPDAEIKAFEFPDVNPNLN